MIDPGVALAALGITLLELSEASAVGASVFAETRSLASSFGAMVLGEIIVLAPAFAAGRALQYVPLFYIRLVSAILLLYFGLRLARSTRRTVLRSRRGQAGSTASEFSEGKGLAATAFSVGVTEALETAIVLEGLLPESYSSTALGFGIGAIAVALLTYVMKEGITRIRVAALKNFVSAMLLTFAAFWFAEAFISISDLILLPIFVIMFVVVYLYAYRPWSKGA